MKILTVGILIVSTVLFVNALGNGTNDEEDTSSGSVRDFFSGEKEMRHKKNLVHKSEYHKKVYPKLAQQKRTTREQKHSTPSFQHYRLKSTGKNTHHENSKGSTIKHHGKKAKLYKKFSLISGLLPVGLSAVPMAVPVPAQSMAMMFASQAPEPGPLAAYPNIIPQDQQASMIQPAFVPVATGQDVGTPDLQAAAAGQQMMQAPEQQELPQKQEIETQAPHQQEQPQQQMNLEGPNYEESDQEQEVSDQSIQPQQLQGETVQGFYSNVNVNGEQQPQSEMPGQLTPQDQGQQENIFQQNQESPESQDSFRKVQPQESIYREEEEEEEQQNAQQGEQQGAGQTEGQYEQEEQFQQRLPQIQQRPQSTQNFDHSEYGGAPETFPGEEEQSDRLQQGEGLQQNAIAAYAPTGKNQNGITVDGDPLGMDSESIGNVLKMFSQEKENPGDAVAKTNQYSSSADQYKIINFGEGSNHVGAEGPVFPSQGR